MRASTSIAGGGRFDTQAASDDIDTARGIGRCGGNDVDQATRVVGLAVENDVTAVAEQTDHNPRRPGTHHRWPVGRQAHRVSGANGNGGKAALVTEPAASDAGEVSELVGEDRRVGSHGSRAGSRAVCAWLETRDC